MRSFLGIELDDKSHQRDDRKERDQFIDQVFKAAGIPLLRVPVKHTYSLQEVQSILQPYIQQDASQPLPPDDKPQQSWTTPRCTKCGSEIPVASLPVLRGATLCQIRTQPGQTLLGLLQLSKVQKHRAS
jgi:hypothetical protein